MLSAGQALCEALMEAPADAQHSGHRVSWEPVWQCQAWCGQPANRPLGRAVQSDLRVNGEFRGTGLSVGDVLGDLTLSLRLFLTTEGLALQEMRCRTSREAVAQFSFPAVNVSCL